MTYLANITVKGQITIPGLFRKKMNLKKTTKLVLSLNEKNDEIRIKPLPDFFQVSKSFKVKNKRNVLKAREYLESHYERN